MNESLKFFLIALSVTFSVAFVFYIMRESGVSSPGSNKLKPIVILETVSSCDLLKSNCIYKANDHLVELFFASKVRTMKSFRLESRLSNFKSIIKKVSVTFSMSSMSMGGNSFVLTRQAASRLSNSIWQTSILLPICTSGRSDWEMNFMVETNGEIYKTSIPLKID